MMIRKRKKFEGTGERRLAAEWYEKRNEKERVKMAVAMIVIYFYSRYERLVVRQVRDALYEYPYCTVRTLYRFIVRTIYTSYTVRIVVRISSYFEEFFGS